MSAVPLKRCRDCRRTFTALSDTPLSGLHKRDTWLAYAESMIRQGVTSMIFGEGGSAAPSKQWPEFRDYFAELMKRGIATNIGSYVGSSQIWTHVRGPKPGPPSPEELTRMAAIVRTAMQQGALGVASSLSGPPGSLVLRL